MDNLHTKNNLHCIYVLLDESGNIFYVGKAKCLKGRIQKHIGQVRKGNHLPVYNKLRQVLNRNGWNRQNICRAIEENIPETNVDSREIHYIKFYREQGIRLKNLTDGGEGGRGVSPEIIERRAAKLRGIPLSEIRKQKISEAKKGIPLSDEHKSALKKAWEQRPPLTQEFRDKIGMMNRGVINIKQFVVESSDGTIVITDRGLTDFCRVRELDARNLINTKPGGSRKQHKGWRIIREYKKPA